MEDKDVELCKETKRKRNPRPCSKSQGLTLQMGKALSREQKQSDGYIRARMEGNKGSVSELLVQAFVYSPTKRREN